MKLHFSFNYIGLIIFLLPMIINIFYAAFPPSEEKPQDKKVFPVAEAVEKISRIAYLFAIAGLKSAKPLRFNSFFFCFAIIFLVLYYLVWIRYFINGRKINLLSKPYLFVPVPLAIFPVLYFLFAALWLNNLVGFTIMLIFGAAHIYVSVKSF